MNTTAIDFWKKFFLKCFIVSFALTYISFFLWLGMKDFSFNLAHNLMGIDKTSYNNVVLYFFAVAKFFIFYVLLTPALALYWVSRCQKAEWKKNIKLDDED